MTLTTCAFTGNHPLRFDFGYDEDDQLCEIIKSSLLSQIKLLYKKGITTYYSDCEIGTGMWAAELVLGLMSEYTDIHLVCTIPHELQAKRWTPELRNRYFTILEKSTSNILISSHYTNDCNKLCGEYMVNHAKYLIAVYDNGRIINFDNAARIIAYARKKHRNIICINPDNAKITTIQ